MKRFFKRLKIKTYIQIVKLFTIQPKNLTDSEIKASAICRKLITNNDSKFLIAPLSGKRYIKNEPLGMFIVLSDKQINITNHIYNYDISVSLFTSDKLKRMFNKKVEESRLKFESDMTSQVQHSLSTILKKVSDS